MSSENSDDNCNDDCYVNDYDDGNNNNSGVSVFSRDRQGGRESLDDSDYHNECHQSRLPTLVIQV